MRLFVYLMIGMLSLHVGEVLAADLVVAEAQRVAAKANGCFGALGAANSNRIVCFRDDVIDKGLATEMKGCAARIYDLNTKTFISWSETSPLSDLILQPEPCGSGSINSLVKLPVAENQNVGEAIAKEFRNKGKVFNISTSPKRIYFIAEFVKSVNQAFSEDGSQRSRGLEEGTGQESGAAEPPMAVPAAPEPVEKYTNVKVFFASDRKYVKSPVPAENFIDARRDSEHLTLGTVDVSIPADHIPGQIELPSVFSLQMTPDPSRFVVLNAVKVFKFDRDFYRQLRARVKKSGKKDLFVFVHGFNVSFEAAALRTAQLAFDMKFVGAPVFYSWPSETILRYTTAEKNVEWTFEHLQKFLKDLAAQSGAEQIHLIAHSMGNRALTKALHQLAISGISAHPVGDTKSPTFQNVILAAADVGQTDFREIEQAVRSTTKSLTLYASNYDRALSLSAAIHQEPRLGQAGSDLALFPDVETIDASNIDRSFVNRSLLGHSYYGDSLSVVKDLESLIVGAQPASQRAGLTLIPSDFVPYWQIDVPE